MESDSNKINKYYKAFNQMVQAAGPELDKKLSDAQEIWDQLTDEEKSIAHEKVLPLRKRLKGLKEGAKRP
jgi:hypothetical protein